NLIPDAIASTSEELFEILKNPTHHLPLLERLIIDPTPHDGSIRRITQINRFTPDTHQRSYVPVQVLGRMFANYSDLSRRRQWHELTLQVHTYKSGKVFPEPWFKAVIDVVTSILKEVP